jgi:hypothetical protein
MKNDKSWEDLSQSEKSKIIFDGIRLFQANEYSEKLASSSNGRVILPKFETVEALDKLNKIVEEFLGAEAKKPFKKFKDGEKPNIVFDLPDRH